MNKISKSIKGILLVTISSFVVGCSNEGEEFVPDSCSFEDLRFVVNVDRGDVVTRAEASKRDWSIGDKIIMAIDENNTNLCRLQYRGDGKWTVTKYDEKTSFAKDNGALTAVHADSLNVDNSSITTCGDILYTEKGSYVKHNNVVEITLDMNERPVSRIAIVGMDSSFWIDNLTTYTKLQTISPIKWDTNASSEDNVYNEVYGDTCVFYGILPNSNGNTEITLVNKGGTTYRRTYSSKTAKAGDYIIINGPQSDEADEWDNHIPVIGITAKNKNIKMMEGSKMALSDLYILSPSKPTNSNVKAVSSNPSVVKVNSDGTITALATGEATITITTEEGNFKADVAVSVKDIVDFVEVRKTGSSIMSIGGIVMSSVSIQINNTSPKTIHLVSLGGASIDADLAGNTAVSYTLSNRWKDITKESFELKFTVNGVSYSKMSE